MRRVWFAALAVILGWSAPSALACDTCGLYCPAEAPDAAVDRNFSFGLSEQFTSMGSIRQGGLEVANPENEYLRSSLTQFFVAYDLQSRLALRLNIPLLVRDFRRIEAGETVQKTTSGVGDVLFFADWTVFRSRVGGFDLQAKLLGGIKFPTGSTKYLKEEGRRGHGKPASPTSAIHGRDVTLGSGSIDVSGGFDGSVGFGRFLLGGNIQYARRSTGPVEYRFGDDLNWRGGPAFQLGNENFRTTVQALLSGEHKDADQQYGVDFQDTSKDAIYLGPLISSSWKRKLGLELGFGVPLKYRHDDLTAIPDWRVRVGVNWHVR